MPDHGVPATLGRSSAVGHDPPMDDRLESRLEFETLISNASAALFATPPDRVDVAAERVLESVRELFRVDRCVLLRVRADSREVRVRLAAYAEGIEPLPPELDLAPLFPWSWHTLIVERAPIRVSRIGDLPPEADVERESWIRMPIRSALTLPIETRGIVGHMIVLNTVNRERAWPDVLVTRLHALGEMLVGALERQRMFAELRDSREALRASEARLASGAELAGLGFYEVDSGKGAVYLGDRLRELCGFPADSTQGLEVVEFWLEHVHPEDRERVKAGRRELHEGASERFSTEYRYLHPLRGQKWIRHLAGVAERDAAGRAVRTFGVLHDITEIKRVEEELHELSRRLIRAHEEERALLARELHDDVTQRLAVLAIDIGRVESTAPEPALAGTMREIRERLVRLSEDVHSIAYHLHPSVLEELGLDEALRTECERIGRRGGITFSVDLDPLPAAVPKDVALCLFRVAQEALNNVNRHARAHAANVTLRPMDGGLLLAVRDDGVGFDPPGRHTRRSLGLASMTERVRLVNGTLDIESAPGRGTAIVVWVPLAPEMR